MYRPDLLHLNDIRNNLDYKKNTGENFASKTAEKTNRRTKGGFNVKSVKNANHMIQPVQCWFMHPHTLGWHPGGAGRIFHGWLQTVYQQEKSMPETEHWVIKTEYFIFTAQSVTNLHKSQA